MLEDSYTIAVFGSSAIKQDSEQAQEAYRLGYALAEAGFTICNGGYMGVMEAVSRGTQEAGSEVYGVTCELFDDRMPNPYLTEEYESLDLPERISHLMRMSDGYVIFPGNIGTLAELFLSWNLAAMGYGRPVIVVGENMKQAILSLQRYTEICDKQLRLLTFVENAEEATRVILQWFKMD